MTSVAHWRVAGDAERQARVARIRRRAEIDGLDDDTRRTRAELAAATAALAPCSHVSGMVRSSLWVLGLLGEPSVSTNMTFGTPARSLLLLAAPVVMPAPVGVRPDGPLSALTAVWNVPTAVYPLVMFAGGAAAEPGAGIAAVATGALEWR